MTNKTPNPKPETRSRYTEAVGRRKTAVARVRLTKGKGAFMVAGKKFEEYFQLPRLREMIAAPFEQLQMKDYDAEIRVVGGGIAAQAEAVRLGIARALVMLDAETKKKLRALGYLTRDPRMVERKKPGLKKARRAPQWSKR